MSNEDRQNVPVQYNYLILATGATHSYFGHSEFEKYAPGLKTLADAEAIRNNILNAFERAEAEEDPRRRLDLLTFVLVGAGPTTGVEMSGAIGELVRSIKCGLERGLERVVSAVSAYGSEVTMLRRCRSSVLAP
jgi:NADH:ubiquinone reductase (H+-translocating)